MTFNEIHDLIEYKDGVLYWKKDHKNVKKGTIAGSQRPDGYIVLGILKHRLRAHRLIWFMHFGYFPEYLDHINGIRNDNRIENLRVVTRRQNQMNMKTRCDNSSGFRGVFWNKQHKRWTARIQTGYKVKHLGLFESIEDADKARKIAEQKYFGEYARQA